MILSEEEKAAFIKYGRHKMTGLAIQLRELDEWRKTFEQLGGAAEFGADAGDIVSFVANPLLILRDGDQTMLNVMARLRTDLRSEV